MDALIGNFRRNWAFGNPGNLLRGGGWLRGTRPFVHRSGWPEQNPVQPRLRTLVWREMPPCVRRLGIAWSRRLFYVELFLGRLYRSWTKSPTWNFVAVAGTLGILLTVLLFLAPWGSESAANGAAKRLTAPTSRPAWELDARLVEIESTESEQYPIELLPAQNRRSRRTTSLAADEEVPVRRHRTSRRDEPILPEFAEESVEIAFPHRHRRAPEPVTSFDDDWFDVEKSSSPDLGLDVEVLVPKRRTRRDRIVADAVLGTGRSLPPDIEIASRKHRRDRNDDWTASDPDRIVREEREFSAEFVDDAIPASHADRLLGSAWEPVPFPETAPTTADVAMEIWWNRRTNRRRSEPKLSMRNVGENAIARIDILPGLLPTFDLSAATDVQTQSISALAARQEESVTLPLGSIHRRSRKNLVSVLVTTFVGGTTRVVAERIEPVATSARSELPEPPPRKRREIRREPDRPHLQMSVGKPGRLPREKMVSVPIRVLNDGNVPLSDVVILANIPATLEHEHGRQVHYRLGRLEPGQLRHSTLLLTPLEAGSAVVPLRAIDGNRLASATGEAGVDVSDEELAEVRVRRSRLRRQATSERPDEFGPTPPQ